MMVKFYQALYGIWQNYGIDYAEMATHFARYEARWIVLEKLSTV